MRYNIPLENMPQFAQKIDKLAKRAKKLGLVGPVISEVGTHMQSHNGDYVEVVEVEMTFGDEVKIQGWKLLAKIEHLPTGNLIKAFAEMDPKWRDAEPNCEHCNQNRRRNVTYILSNEREIQVGSTCLKDFTGHADAEALADYFAQIQELEEIDEFGYDPDAAYSTKLVRVEKYLAYVAMSVHERGYVSRKKADIEFTLSTADDAFALMSQKKTPIQKDRELAQAVVAYAETLEATNDFEHNVKVLLADEYVHINNCGYVAGAVSAYLRTQEVATSGKEYVGTIKKRENFTLTVASEKLIDGMYGVTHLYKFTDENGNTLVWFSSKDQEFAIGETYTIKATVKAHKEFNGEKQTVITRGKVQ
jgi:hypothetical protein